MIPSYNPFEAIEKRLTSIEQTLASLNVYLTKTDDHSNSDVIDIDEVAKILHISKDTVYTKTHKKTIPHWKEGKRLLFSRNRILAYLANGEVKTFHDEFRESERLIKEKITNNQTRNVLQSGATKIHSTDHNKTRYPQ